MLTKNAVQNPDTLNPRTSHATSSIMSAFITRMKSPNVMSVNGRVSKIRIGRMIAFANPNSSAETIKDDLLSNEMPRKTWLATQSESARIAQWSRKGIRCANIYVLR